MLSGPPRSRARRTSSVQAALVSSSLTIFRISSSWTRPQRPSVQSTSTSPFSRTTGLAGDSALTSPPAPRAAVGMGFSLVGVKDAGLDQAADVGMVAGEAGNGASANQVEPAVTDVRHVEAVVVERERGASGAHAVELGVGFGVAADAGVGFLKPFQERGAGVPGGVVVINVLDGLDGEAAGFLAAFVSTHPVGDEGQSSLLLESLVTLGLPVGKRILIVFALAAHVAQAGDFDSRTNLHTPLGGNLAWTARHETAVTPLPPRARTGPRLRGHPPVCPAWPDDYKRTCGLRVPGNKY